ncbi:MAG: S9 family peptidase [Ilumatobacteraceae bacterium]
MKIPHAKQVEHVWKRPTGSVDDPWAWLRDRDDPDAVRYLEAENAFADAWFEPHAPVVEALFEEIKSRVLETDLAAPVRKDEWWYTTRTEEGLSYAIHCRGRSRDSATSEILVDENAEAAGHQYFDLNIFDVSPDHRLLAWSSDTDGSERYVMHIRELTTGADLADTLTNTSWAGSAWSPDNEMLFYVQCDEAMRPHQVWRHTLGTDQADDVLVFEEPDERFFVSIELTRSEQWIVIDTSSKVSSEVLLIAASDPAGAPLVVRPREPDLEYHVDHWGDRFVIVTNLDALDFRVMTAPLDAPGQWSDLVAHEPGRRITGVEPFAAHLVIHEWFAAQQRVRVLFRNGGERVLDIGDEPHELELESNPTWETETVRYTYQSFTTPVSVYEENVRNGERVLLKQNPAPNLDLRRYTASREWATAPDGALVPVDIVRCVDVESDGTAPCAVYGYGSYEASMAPWFSVARFSLLDRGWTWALVHPRGGGELGRRWYLDGKLLNKRNTFSDTIASCEHLVAMGWAAADRLSLRGASAGGLLVGACVTMRPDLFSSAVAEVPFVDVVSTMSDPTLPLTITEWEEWGDPRDEPAASYIAGYSPYDNTTAGDYPAMYVTAGINDPRVSYHESAKWVAKLRHVWQTERPLVFKCEMGAGHGGPSGRYDRWRDEARVLAFVIATT